jgi:hypothetical protein
MESSSNKYLALRYVVALVAIFLAALVVASSASAGSQSAGKGDAGEPAHNSPTPTATPVMCTIQFADVPADNSFYSSVLCLACRGVVRGYPCGGEGEPCNENNDPYYRPNLPVTRGQVAKMVSESAGFQDDVTGQTFEDVPPGSTFYVYVERLATRSVIQGYACGGTNEPCVAPDNRPYYRLLAHTNRGQLVKIARRAADHHMAAQKQPSSGTPAEEVVQTFADVPVGSTYYVDVEGMVQTSPGLLNGYACGGPDMPCDDQQRPYMRPTHDVTRGQAAKIIVGQFFPGCNQH